MATVVTADLLRRRLGDLAAERGRHEAAGRELERAIGEALLEVRETPGLTLTEACGLLGFCRPTGYRLLGAAE